MTEDGGKYFSPRHVCDAIGVSWQGQLQKIRNTKRFESTVKNIFTMRPDGSQAKAVMLPAEKLTGWLNSINPNRCKIAVRKPLEKFQNEADAVLDAWFRKGHRNEESRMKG